VTFHLRAGVTSCRLCYPARPRSRNSPEKEISLGGEPPHVSPVCDARETNRYRRLAVADDDNVSAIAWLVRHVAAVFLRQLRPLVCFPDTR